MTCEGENLAASVFFIQDFAVGKNCFGLWLFGKAECLPNTDVTQSELEGGGGVAFANSG